VDRTLVALVAIELGTGVGGPLTDTAGDGDAVDETVETDTGLGTALEIEDICDGEVTVEGAAGRLMDESEVKFDGAEVVLPPIVPLVETEVIAGEGAEVDV